MLHILSKHNKLPELWHIPVHVREKKKGGGGGVGGGQKKTIKQKIQPTSSSRLI